MLDHNDRDVKRVMAGFTPVWQRVTGAPVNNREPPKAPAPRPKPKPHPSGQEDVRYPLAALLVALVMLYTIIQ